MLMSYDLLSQKKEEIGINQFFKLAFSSPHLLFNDPHDNDNNIKNLKVQSNGEAHMAHVS